MIMAYSVSKSVSAHADAQYQMEASVILHN